MRTEDDFRYRARFWAAIAILYALGAAIGAFIYFH